MLHEALVETVRRKRSNLEQCTYLTSLQMWTLTATVLITQESGDTSLTNQNDLSVNENEQFR